MRPVIRPLPRPPLVVFAGHLCDELTPIAQVAE